MTSDVLGLASAILNKCDAADVIRDAWVVVGLARVPDL